MYITMGKDRFRFEKIGIEVLETGLENVFSRFDKMTLEQLIHQKKYEHLRSTTQQEYCALLGDPAGQALMELKEGQHDFYREFLNNYGDLSYTKFVVEGSEESLQKKGVYMVLCDEELVFAGVCARSFRERFNQHLGNISAKGCYRDGTATHCHINAQLTRKLAGHQMSLAICTIDNKKEMNQLKNAIINRFEPIWNLRSNQDAFIFADSI
ncbi:MAG: hypothetical protein ABS951_18265 [Solibacillus sp.]